MTRPDWLVEALRKTCRGTYPWRQAGKSSDIMQGDIVLVSEMDLSGHMHRMVVVLDVDPERRCFSGALVSNELSLATADDVILSSDHTGLPYDIAVINQLVGYMWLVQVEELLGALSEEAIDACLAGSVGAENEFQFGHRGIPLQDQIFDLRWPTLESELAALHVLTLDCTANRHKEPVAPFVDPRLFPVFDNSLDESSIEALNYLVNSTREGTARGLSPSCVESIIGHIDTRIMRAYGDLFSTQLTPISGNRCEPREDHLEQLLELTKVDGLSEAPFVKIIGAYDSPTYETLEYQGRRAEYLYSTVKEAA